MDLSLSASRNGGSSGLEDGHGPDEPPIPGGTRTGASAAFDEGPPPT